MANRCTKVLVFAAVALTQEFTHTVRFHRAPPSTEIERIVTFEEGNRHNAPEKKKLAARDFEGILLQASVHRGCSFARFPDEPAVFNYPSLPWTESPGPIQLYDSHIVVVARPCKAQGTLEVDPKSPCVMNEGHEAKNVSVP